MGEQKVSNPSIRESVCDTVRVEVLTLPQTMNIIITNPFGEHIFTNAMIGTSKVNP